MTTPEQLDLAAARRLALDTHPWLSCDDCFDEVDAAVESVVLARAGLQPGFRAHLRGCPACHEEAQSLAELVADEAGLDRDAALALLDAEVAVREG